MLKNAVDGLAELRNIKTADAQIYVTNDTIISYDVYVSLMYNTAQSYNTQFTTRISSKWKKCTLYRHEMNSYENDEEYEHNVDTNIEYLIVNFTNLNILKQTQKIIRGTPYQIHELSSESQHTWDQLDDNSKSMMLTTTKNKKQSSLSTK